jgi:transposase
MDVHKATISVSVAEAGAGEVRHLGEIEATPEAVAKLVKRLHKDGGKLLFCYEAGPCGYGLYRQLRVLGESCRVVAPSMIPKKAGDRVKTDRRDSLNLTRLLRSNDLTAVWVPAEPQEALRDLTRAREDQVGMLHRAKQHLQALLLRHGKVFPGKNPWTQAHERWLEAVRFDQPLQQIVFQEAMDLVHHLGRRIQEMDREIEAAGSASAFAPLIRGLMALRGINRLSATTLAAEIGELHRFPGGPELMGYLGLVPSEHSSGSRVSRGGLTKTGNGHARRVLVEAAWTYRFQARKTAHLQRRAEQAPEAVQEIAWKAQKRLCARYRHLQARGKPMPKVCAAIARELVGFIWAIGQAYPPLEPTSH